MGTMFCTVPALQHNIAKMVFHPEFSKLLHDANRRWSAAKLTSGGPEGGTNNLACDRWGIALQDPRGAIYRCSAGERHACSGGSSPSLAASVRSIWYTHEWLQHPSKPPLAPVPPPFAIPVQTSRAWKAERSMVEKARHRPNHSDHSCSWHLDGGCPASV
mmetsp:Transcript_36725/g.79154  ORF Transcript_36725/g.79154 Transcript_36725/m.79154 type:complete len:160 (-) Transcript_36725:115-594(-)